MCLDLSRCKVGATLRAYRNAVNAEVIRYVGLKVVDDTRKLVFRLYSLNLLAIAFVSDLVNQNIIAASNGLVVSGYRCLPKHKHGWFHPSQLEYQAIATGSEPP